MSKAVQRAILQMEREQERAINKGDIASATSMFDRSFVGFSSTTHDRIRGLAPLRATFRHYLDQSPQLKYKIEKPQVLVSGNTAVATFYWQVTLGEGRVLKGRGTHVFARHGRAWRVVHEHFSRAH